MRLGVFFWGVPVLLAACASDDFSGAPAGKGGSSGAPTAGASGKATGRGGSGGASGAAGDASGGECTPGATRECVGPGACRGGQTCDGEGWSKCDCGETATGGSGNAGAPSSGGSTVGATGGGGAQHAGAGAGAGDDGTAGDPNSEEPCAKATGSITIGVNTLLGDGDTFTIDDGLHGATTFTFDWDDGGTPIGGANVIHFSGTPTEADLAVLICDAINGAFNFRVTATTSATDDASSSGGNGADAPRAEQIELTNDLAGPHGNVPISDTVANPNFKTSGMSGGAGEGC